MLGAISKQQTDTVSSNERGIWCYRAPANTPYVWEGRMNVRKDASGLERGGTRTGNVLRVILKCQGQSMSETEKENGIEMQMRFIRTVAF